jgi:TonB family protein
VDRRSQRQGFVVSAILHLSILMMLAFAPLERPQLVRRDPAQFETRERVFLPTPEVLRSLRPVPPAPSPDLRPAPLPTPPPRPTDRISVGPPSELRAAGPMLLRPDDDLTAVPRGVRRPEAPQPPPEAAAEQGEVATPGSRALRLPPGLLGTSSATGDSGAEGHSRPMAPAIANAIRDVEQRLERDSRLGLPTGTGQNIGGLYFDPQGADFTVWVNHFKNEVYRNWIVPQPALLGFRGRVGFEFTVERDGRLSALRGLSSSGMVALDRAAHNALTSSRLLPLPADYAPPAITIQVTFYYNEAP